MTQLQYVGGPEQWIGGWPADDHEELDTALAAEKVASGLYVDVTPVVRAASEEPDNPVGQLTPDAPGPLDAPGPADAPSTPDAPAAEQPVKDG